MSGDVVLKKYSGSCLRKLRIERNMTQQSLAQELTELKKNYNEPSVVTRQTISKYENGERGMSLETISDLANIFQIPVNYFFPNSGTFNTAVEHQTHNLFSKIIVDDDGFSLEIKTAIPFDELDLEEQKEIMDSSMEELLELKKKIRSNQAL